MKKIIFSFLVLVFTTTLYGQGVSIVHDPTSHWRAVADRIEQMRKTVEHIELTIKTIENQYEQIKAAKEALEGINWEEMGNMFKVGEYTNPIEAMQAHLDMLSAIEGKIHSDFMSVNGNPYSIADLVGMNGADKDIKAFFKEGKTYAKANYNKLHKALTQTLTEAERVFIVKKTGMLPEDYAMEKKLKSELGKRLSEVEAIASEGFMHEISEKFSKSTDVLNKVLNDENATPMQALQAIAILNRDVTDAILQLNVTMTKSADAVAMQVVLEEERRRSQANIKRARLTIEEARNTVDVSETFVNSLKNFGENITDEDAKEFVNFEDSEAGTFKFLF